MGYNTIKQRSKTRGIFKQKMKPINQPIFQWITLILGTLILISIIVVAVIIAKNIEIFKTSPCQACMDAGFSCIKLNMEAILPLAFGSLS